MRGRGRLRNQHLQNPLAVAGYSAAGIAHCTCSRPRTDLTGEKSCLACIANSRQASELVANDIQALKSRPMSKGAYFYSLEMATVFVTRVYFVTPIPLYVGFERIDSLHQSQQRKAPGLSRRTKAVRQGKIMERAVRDGDMAIRMRLGLGLGETTMPLRLV